MDRTILATDTVSNRCPECDSTDMLPDPELGELYCPNCGCTVETPESTLATEGIIHKGTPSFSFLYDKGLTTTFRPTDLRDERVVDFKRLAAIDRAAKGIRPRESSVLNVSRNIMPILEQNFRSAPGVINRVKTRVAEITVKHTIPRIEGIYQALVCHALLELGIRVDRKKALMELTNSRCELLKRPPPVFTYLPEKKEWLCEFEIEDDYPNDRLVISVRAQSNGGEMRGNATAWISTTPIFDIDEEAVLTSSRVVDGRLRIHLQTNKTTYAKGESVVLTAQVTSDDGTAHFDEQDIEMRAYIYSGGWYRTASRALWVLHNVMGVSLRPPSGRDFLRECKLLSSKNKLLAMQTLETLEHVADQYGVWLQPRQLAAVAARLHLPNYDEKRVAEEFVMGVSALTSKMSFLDVLQTNASSLVIARN